MNFSSLGDLAQNLVTRRQTSTLNNQLAQLTSELTTGKKSDLGGAVGGDYSVFASMTRSLALQDAYDDARNQISPRLDAMQTALTGIAEPAGEIGFEVINAVNSENEVDLERSISTMRDELESVVGLLNTRVADRSVFGGVATDQPALADPEDILAALQLEVAGAVDIDDFLSRVDTWFGAGGGFETVGYLGGDAPTAGVPVSASLSVTQDITASTSDIRDVVKNFALLSLAQDGTVEAEGINKRDIMQQAASSLIDAQRGVIDLQAGIGDNQNKVERATAQTAAERLGLEQAQNALVSADPFETATRLEEVRTQLETLYIVTARTSQLNLASFLR